MSDSGDPEIRVLIRDHTDLVVARRHVRVLCGKEGLSTVAAEALATAVTEIARNLVVHAGSGELRLRATRHASGRGVVVIAQDDGPGIPDVARAMRDGYSSGGGGLGLGLPGAQRLVDDFQIESIVGRGTKVVLRQWASKEKRK